MNINQIEQGTHVKFKPFRVNSYGEKSASAGQVVRVDTENGFVYVRVGVSGSSGFASDTVQFSADELEISE